MTVQGVKTRLKKKVDPYIKSLGFEERYPSGYKREPFNSVISFTVKTWGSDFTVQSILARSYRTIEDKWVKYRHLWGEDHQPYPPTIGFTRVDIDPALEINPHLKYLGEGLEEIKSEEDIARYAELFRTEYETLYLPFLKQTENIHWLDEELNKDPYVFSTARRRGISRNGAAFRNIIVARLAGNADYEVICQAARVFLREWAEKEEEGKKRAEAFELVYEELKLVEPLPSPLLTA